MPLFNEDGSPQHTTIELRTRLNKKIGNIQPWSYSQFEWNQLLAQPSKYERLGAVPVGEMCPVYNCHGLTFASRRTQVEETNAVITMILEDDGFKEIPNRAEVVTGDVIIYYGQDGTINHSGIVVERGAPPFHFPKVWSKWGKGYAWVHPSNVSPYVDDVAETKFYRIKEWNFQQVFSRT